MRSRIMDQYKHSVMLALRGRLTSTTSIYLYALILIIGQHTAFSLVIDKQQASQSQSVIVEQSNSQKSQYDNDQQQPRTGSIAQRDYKRPIWNIAHMVNSIKELDYRLSKGANAIEADVTFNSQGAPTFVYHGPPCDCWRHCYQQEEFNDYLAYVHEITLAGLNDIGKNLSLLFLDLKLDYLSSRAKEEAGKELAKSVMFNLYPRYTTQLAKLDRLNRKKLRLIISINHVTDIELVNNFIHTLEIHNSSDLMQQIGFDVGMNDDIQLIESMWRKYAKTVQVPLNLWQGDGFTNCISPFYNLERLSKAIMKRDNEHGYPQKVYQWTIDLHDRIREALMMGVDAIMTNHPERVLTVLAESEVAHHFRLATRDDDPFKKIPTKSIYRNSGGARYARTISPVSGGLIGSLMDVFNSLLSYVREIPYLSLPTTRFFNKVRRQFRLRSNGTDEMGLESRTSRTTIPSNNIAFNYTISSSQSTSRSYTGQQNLPLIKRSTTTMMTSTPQTQTISTTTTAPITTTTMSGSDDTITTMISRNETDGQAKDSSEVTEKPNVFEPPSWYTSMASNFLVSMLKLALPINVTTSTTTTESPD